MAKTKFQETNTKQIPNPNVQNPNNVELDPYPLPPEAETPSPYGRGGIGISFLISNIWVRAMVFIMVSFIFSLSAQASIYTYNFPKPGSDWGKPISFTNLSPGFFQVMYQDKSNVIRIATYGIAGASMDTLKDPQLLMVFVFNQSKLTSNPKLQNVKLSLKE